MIKHLSDEWVNEWCQENGWTDLVIDRCNYWAFPPGAVMPEPIPPQALKLIKAQKGLSTSERLWSISAVGMTLAAGVSSLVLMCPMPLVFAFAFDAVTVALLDGEES